MPAFFLHVILHSGGSLPVTLHKTEAGDRIVHQERFLSSLEEFFQGLILELERDRSQAFCIQLILHVGF